MDALVKLGFEEYTKRYYESWVAFARDKKYGKNVNPILVSGFDMAKDFEMVAYLDDSSSAKGALYIDVPAVVSASASLWDTRRIRCSPHTNKGPQRGAPLPSFRTIGFPSSQSVKAGSIPREFNQCVFVRYYTMRSRKRLPMFPKKMKAAAGPHDLGPGDNSGDTFPELTTQLDVECTASGDEDFEGQWGSDTNDNSEPDVVVRNTPYVRFL